MAERVRALGWKQVEIIIEIGGVPPGAELRTMTRAWPAGADNLRFSKLTGPADRTLAIAAPATDQFRGAGCRSVGSRAGGSDAARSTRCPRPISRYALQQLLRAQRTQERGLALSGVCGGPGEPAERRASVRSSVSEFPDGQTVGDVLFETVGGPGEFRDGV